VSLHALQREFQDWLTNERVEVGARLGDGTRAGLAIYLNNYRAQLLACLAVSFPSVRTLMGAGAFEVAAATHIDAVPPHAWTLDDYPAKFPATLERLHAADPQVAELAWLELRLASAFVGADVAPLDPAALVDVDWDAARIELVPTFSLLPVTTNAGEIWSAINAYQAALPAVTRLREPQWLLIWRKHFTPQFRAIMNVETEVLAQVRDGVRFGAICASLVARLGDQAGTAAAGEMLGKWLADGLIAAIAH
jgi:hypothetical protein